ncbi:MAG: hypothetical protein F6K16_11090 [Symploca sp. SIO2B6]|nr:hypothetical protein [Symploca sp. SIO2B6]
MLLGFNFTIDGAIECGHYWIKVPKLGKLKTYERFWSGTTAEVLPVKNFFQGNLGTLGFGIDCI